MAVNIRAKLETEIKQLEHELAIELPAELKRAVALGDLSENAEYHMAKQRQEFVNARLGQLKKRLSELALVNVDNIPRDRAAYGSIVLLHDLDKGEDVEYRLVTSEEADVAQGRISTSSPIGRGILGKRPGDEVRIQTPNGVREYEVLKLQTIYELEAAGDSTL
ncbi:MAG: transcription elongation factor GreA [Acidobacteria bacterium]|nr:MAG: transcription elongation factor GreA [Acidobacteriota bacterium]